MAALHAENEDERGAESTLVNRNVVVSGHRTSIRLEPGMWDALDEICRREGQSAHAICSLIDARRFESSLTAAVRVFIVSYFRSAATELGHANVGHGRLNMLNEPAHARHAARESRLFEAQVAGDAHSNANGAAEHAADGRRSLPASLRDAPPG